MVYNRYAGIVSLPGADGKTPRPFRVDEDGNVIYLDTAQNTGMGEKPVELARAGVLGWDELARKLDKERSKMPARVLVDPSCATVPAAYDPGVQKTALKALRRSVDDPGTGTLENGFFASEKLLEDGYSTGPIFNSGRQRSLDPEQIQRRKPGTLKSLQKGTYLPSLFVHTHPNNKPPSPPREKDQRASNAIETPIAAIDTAGNLFCVLPKRR